MKITFKQLKEIDQIYGKIMKNKETQKSKLAYAFKRFSDKNSLKYFKEYNTLSEDIKIDNALTDEKTQAILYKPDGISYQYSREGLKTMLKSINELSDKWDKKEIEVEPFICKEIPSSIEFTEDEIETLKGLIIE